MIRPLLSTLTALTLLTGAALAEPHTYQVTGPILALTDTSITVQKGTEKWEISRDASTNVTGDLKVGGKVTIEYSMTASTITAKDDKAAGAAAPAAGAAKATPAPKKKK